MIADLEARISNVLVHKNKTVAIPSISINSDDDKAGKFAEWYSHTLNYFEEELLQYGNSAASGSAFVTFNSIIRGVHSTSLHDGTNPATSNVNTLADMEMTPVYSDYLMKIDSDMYDLFREFILASINDAGLVTVIRDHNPSPTSLKCQSLILIVRNHYVVSSSAMPLTATMIPFRLDNGQGQSSFAYITASSKLILYLVHFSSNKLNLYSSQYYFCCAHDLSLSCIGFCYWSPLRRTCLLCQFLVGNGSTV